MVSALEILFGIIIVVFAIGFIGRFLSLLLIMQRHIREERIGVQEVQGIPIEPVPIDNPLLADGACANDHDTLHDVEVDELATLDSGTVSDLNAPTARASQRIIMIHDVIAIEGDPQSMHEYLV